MADHVPSASHSDLISSLDFEDTSFWNELNLDSLLEIENDLYKLLQPSVEAEPAVQYDPPVKVVEGVLSEPLSEIVIEKEKKNRVKRTFCYSKTVTKQMISSFFHLPVSKAAEELKLGVTTLKLRCRELGIRRWPREKLSKLEDEDEQEIPFSSPDQDYRPVFELTDNSALDYQFNIPFLPSIGESSHANEPVCDFQQEIHHDLEFMNVMIGEHHDVATDAPSNVEEVSKSGETIIVDKRTSKPWSFDTISPLFHLPASQAAKELNVSEDKLTRMCKKLGVKRWPYRKLHSLDNLLENLQYLSKLKTYIVGKERVIELKEEKKRILKDPNIELCAETQVLMESSRKKRRYRHLMDTSYSSHYANSSIMANHVSSSSASTDETVYPSPDASEYPFWDAHCEQFPWISFNAINNYEPLLNMDFDPFWNFEHNLERLTVATALDPLRMDGIFLPSTSAIPIEGDITQNSNVAAVEQDTTTGTKQSMIEKIVQKQAKRTKKTFRDPSTITKAMLSTYFHMPIHKAAKELGVEYRILKRRELDGANFPTFTYPLSEPQSKSMTSTNEKTLQDLSNALMHVVSIKDIYEKGKAGEFWIGGQIVAIENSYNWFVLCCQANDCNNQLIPLPSGEYECKKCLTNWTKGIDKYNLKLQVEDANGNAKLKLVDKDCIQLIGKTASDLRAKHRRITPQLPKEIQSLVGLGMLFMVDVKREQLENRYAPFSVTKIINDQTLVSLYCPEVLDAAEAAERQAFSATSGAVTKMVSQRFGENAGEATQDALATAGHTVGTAWNVLKIRKAITPGSSVTSGVRNAAKNSRR
nr:replication factor A protein 1-like [Ipomoea batatas]